MCTLTPCRLARSSTPVTFHQIILQVQCASASISVFFLRYLLSFFQGLLHARNNLFMTFKWSHVSTRAILNKILKHHSCINNPNIFISLQTITIFFNLKNNWKNVWKKFVENNFKNWNKKWNNLISIRR